MDDSALAPLVNHWLAKIRLALEHKEEKFGKRADECMRFFSGPHDWMYSEAIKGQREEDAISLPWFRMSYNKVAEMVQLFGPSLYQQNPHRQVTPRKVPMLPIEYFGPRDLPETQQMFLYLQTQIDQQRAKDLGRATILQAYLNYTPRENNLRTHARDWIDEALIKGRGVLWTEPRQRESGQLIIGSYYDTVDNLVIDPDAETLDDATWIARRVTKPVWAVERKYGIPPGILKPNKESYNSLAIVDSTKTNERRRGQTNDLVVYWEVWSKMGMGGRLAGMAADGRAIKVPDSIRNVTEAYGDYCVIAVTDAARFPLNLPPPTWDLPVEQSAALVQWPVPYWADGKWPMTVLDFHKIPRQIWPMSHVYPALGELRFLNWAFSFLASKVRTTSRDFVAILKSADETLKTQITSGSDLTVLELSEMNRKIDEVCQFLQHPPMNRDILEVIRMVIENFEKRVGLTELMYGQSSSQYRSAAEAEVKAGQISIRPQDMAEQVEEAMTEIAEKELLAARWILKPEDVAPALGPLGAQFWQIEVLSSDFQSIVHQLEASVEAGSTRKPNRQRDVQNMNQTMQTLFQPLFSFASATGEFGPVNALITDWAKTIDLDPTRYLLKPPMPPPMMPGQGPGLPGPQGAQPGQPGQDA